VAYAISAVLSAVGENKLMPDPELQVTVINGSSGYSRPNQSWILGRIIKDYEHWIPDEVDQKLKAVLKSVQEKYPEEPIYRAGLCVSLFDWVDDRQFKAGVPVHDWIWWSGLVVIPIQLGVAAIPWGLSGDWSVFLITACGTVLALVSGVLPQWAREKWSCQRKSKKIVALTQGNGVGLDLEDLASGERANLLSTRILTCILALFWVALLISSTGLEINTWYLLAVGGLGMLQNVVVAGAPRYPRAFGIHLKYEKVYVEEKVMHVLMDLEKDYEGVGNSLRPEFFPGELRPWEVDWWKTSDPQERKALEEKNRRV
jgi:hypothetical protein